MKRSIKLYTIFLVILFCFYSCSSPKYFYDNESARRQKELKNNRASNILTEILAGAFSIFSSSTLNTDIDWYPSEQQFKKVKLINPTDDTIYVNMLTDVYWDEEDYCDFMDIRIPPNENCKLMLPVNTNYNLYFSNTPENDDDEMLELFTNDFKNISLYSGLTIFNDTINLNQ